MFIVSECWLKQTHHWRRNCAVIPNPHIFLTFLKPLWPDIRPLMQNWWSHTWTLKAFLCVSVKSLSVISGDPRKLHLNLEKPWPSLLRWMASGGWRTCWGEFWTLCVAFGARPVCIFSDIDIHAPLPEHFARGCTILQCGSQLDKDKLLLNDFWHQLPFASALWNLESLGSPCKNLFKHRWSR